MTSIALANAISAEASTYIRRDANTNSDRSLLLQSNAETRAYFDALHPHSAGGAYVNFMMDEGEDRVKASYRENYSRLAAVKARYDPANFFRVNQNIRPAA